MALHLNSCAAAEKPVDRNKKSAKISAIALKTLKVLKLQGQFSIHISRKT
jgi:hypothetical protein